MQNFPNIATFRLTPYLPITELIGAQRLTGAGKSQSLQNKTTKDASSSQITPRDYFILPNNFSVATCIIVSGLGEVINKVSNYLSHEQDITERPGLDPKSNTPTRRVKEPLNSHI